MTHDDNQSHIKREILQGERVLFNRSQLQIQDSIFEDGESPLKECADIEVSGSRFKWKYPIWYSDNVLVRDSSWAEMGRAGVWYSNGLQIERCLIEAPKNFRRCRNVSLIDVSFTNAAETLWKCSNVSMERVSARGDYFAMDSENLRIDGLRLAGGYAFDGIRNAEIRNAVISTKDAFWNSENVTVYDSYITGEYLGWNAKNLTLINCTIESEQGMCYVDNLVMENCTLLNTDLAFEYSTVDVSINSHIESIKNPKSGTIRAKSIGEIILDADKVTPEDVTIILEDTPATSPTAAGMLK